MSRSGFLRASASLAGVAMFGKVATARGAEATGLRASFRQLVVCHGRTLHVASAGNDKNRGTARSPFRQIQRAVDVAEPGDLIVVGSGDFAPFRVHAFSGEPAGWLAIMSADD